jgi:hypothetical protein
VCRAFEETFVQTNDVTTQPIQSRIFMIRGQRIMVDFHLSELYGVDTKALNQAVKRNPNRFPEDFMFQLTGGEWDVLKTEIIGSVSGQGRERSQIVTAVSHNRNIKFLPFVFTEPGVAMLSSVLKSDRAIDVNITIIRTFIILRQYISNYTELSEKIAALEKQMNRKFRDIHEALNYLLADKPAAEIGFKQAGGKA